MPDGFNFIFDKLVLDNDDFVGMVAYSIYKQQKIEWLNNFKKENGRTATDAELESFIQFSNLASQLESYRDQATNLIDTFLDVVLADKYEEMQEEIRHNATIAAVKKTFLQSVFENALGGVVATLLTLGAIGIFWVSSQGPERLIREAIQSYASEGPPHIPKAPATP